MPAVLLADKTAAHEIVLITICHGNQIAVTCPCRSYSGGNGRGRKLIASRAGSFPAAEAIAAWRDWHEKNGVVL